MSASPGRPAKARRFTPSSACLRSRKPSLVPQERRPEVVRARPLRGLPSLCKRVSRSQLIPAGSYRVRRVAKERSVRYLAREACLSADEVKSFLTADVTGAVASKPTIFRKSASPAASTSPTSSTSPLSSCGSSDTDAGALFRTVSPPSSPETSDYSAPWSYIAVPCRPEPAVPASAMTQHSLENLERELLHLNEPSLDAYCGFEGCTSATVTVADAATQTEPEPEQEQEQEQEQGSIVHACQSADDFDRASPASATFANLDMASFLGSLDDTFDSAVVLPEWCVDSGALEAEYDPLARVWDDWMLLDTAL